MSPILSFDPAIITNADMSANIESDSISIGEIGGFAVHSVFTGSPIGTLIVSGSNDPSLDFVPIDVYAITTEGSRLLNVERANYVFVKVKYISTSGTGVLNVVISGKII